MARSAVTGADVPTTDEPPGITIQAMTPEERLAIFDRAARFYLHMSGDQFLQTWEAGAFADDPDRPEVVSVYLLSPLGR